MLLFSLFCLTLSFSFNCRGPPSGKGRRSKSTGKEEEKAKARGIAQKLGQHFHGAIPSGAGGVLAQFNDVRSNWKMLRARGGVNIINYKSKTM